MKRRRVKITGIGPVTPAGVGREDFWKGILESVSRIRPFGKLGEEFGPIVAAQVERLHVATYVERPLPTGTARHTQFAIVATMLALRDAGLKPAEIGHLAPTIVTGTGYMDFGGISKSIDAVAEDGASAANRKAPYTVDIGGLPVTVAQTLGIQCRTSALSTQCVAGLDAIGAGAQLIASGETDLVICGGTDAPLNKFPILELRAAGLTPPTTEMADRICRPFDLWRTTGVISEGACMVVLEPESSPRPGYSWVAGYGFANDQGHDMCSGMVEATRRALADASLRAYNIESINAWGPGHRIVDRGEAVAMQRIFGPLLAQIPAVSIKGAIGSPVAAAPAIQVAAAVLAQRFSILPPTVNWEYPDPGCPLNLSNASRSIAHDVTLVNAHALGGLNSAVILQRCR
jgi:3-oxoacyl-[acyl-carrier-protein] synthase II